MTDKHSLRSVCIIAGDPSGDIHGARLMIEIRNHFPNCRFFGIGGNYMDKLGMELVYHNKSTAIMGFTEIIRHAGFIRGMFRTMRRIIRDRKPDAIIFIDYPGFNLRLAEQIRPLGIPQFYYIAPQAWAWKEKRVHTIKKVVDHLFVIFPFEEAYFRQFDIPVSYVGHPFGISIYKREFPADPLEKYRIDHEMPIVAMLPGSREQEIRRHLPVIIKTINLLKEKFPHWQFAISRAPLINGEVWKRLVRGYEEYTYRDNLDVLLHYSAAVAVASGTASLQVAFHRKPMVIFYKTSAITYLMAKRLTRLRNVGMINILNGSELFPELLQSRFTAENLAAEIEKQMLVFVHHPIKLTKMETLIQKLVVPDSCSIIVKKMMEIIAEKSDK